MEQVIEFVENHLFLTLAFLVVAAMLAQNLYADLGSKNNILPLQATELINREDAVVVDVRPIADFNKGHILGAHNIPMGGFANQLGQLERYKEHPLIISCRSGAQSGVACKQLRAKGYTKVYNLRGGIMSWMSAGMPISKK